MKRLCNESACACRVPLQNPGHFTHHKLCSGPFCLLCCSLLLAWLWLRCLLLYCFTASQMQISGDLERQHFRSSWSSAGVLVLSLAYGAAKGGDVMRDEG